MEKYKVVYVVACIEGDYSGQTFWIECCFADKGKAIKFKELKDREEMEKFKNKVVLECDERNYFITETIMINPSIDLESIDINNIFDHLGFPGNEDIYTEEDQ